VRQELSVPEQPGTGLHLGIGGTVGDAPMSVLRPEMTMDEMLSRPYRPSEWHHYIGADPARAPDGDWFGCVVGGIPKRPTRPWYNVPLWAGQVRGTNLVDVFASMMSGPLERFRSFRCLVIDDTHDFSFTDLASKRYLRRVVGMKFTGPNIDDMWKIHYLMHKAGRRYPGRTRDARLNEVWATLLRQIDRAVITFTPTGRVRPDHRKKEHNDLLAADWMQCWASYQDMRLYAMRGTARSARVGSHRPRTPGAPGDGPDYGDMLAWQATRDDYGGLGE